MDDERREYIRELFCQETNEPESQEWREEIAEVETIRDHCRVRLRDGAMYLARLDRDLSLRLDEIDGVC